VKETTCACGRANPDAARFLEQLDEASACYEALRHDLDSIARP
jgi:hypothetical protein